MWMRLTCERCQWFWRYNSSWPRANWLVAIGKRTTTMDRRHRSKRHYSIESLSSLLCRRRVGWVDWGVRGRCALETRLGLITKQKIQISNLINWNIFGFVVLWFFNSRHFEFYFKVPITFSKVTIFF